MLKPLTVILSILMMSALTLPAAHAQGGDPNQPDQEWSPAAETGLDAATKEKFITAYSDVYQIQNELVEKLDGVTDQTAAQELQQQAQQKMITAVEASGLSVGEYNSITQLIAGDPELLSKIQKKAGVNL